MESDEPPQHISVALDPGTGEHGVFARVSFRKGEVLAPFSAAATKDRPDRHTVQVDDEVHIDLAPHYLRFINHSCAPNVLFDVDRYELLVLRDIEAGEEITFFYPATEWWMASPFDCRCGARECVGRIEGAVAIAAPVLAGYRLAGVPRRRLQPDEAPSQGSSAASAGTSWTSVSSSGIST
jgi:hypothetical protein